MRWRQQVAQQQVLLVRALLQGLSVAELAERLGLTVASAQTYTKRLYRRLGVTGHKALVAWLLASDAP